MSYEDWCGFGWGKKVGSNYVHGCGEAPEHTTPHVCAGCCAEYTTPDDVEAHEVAPAKYDYTGFLLVLIFLIALVGGIAAYNAHEHAQEVKLRNVAHCEAIGGTAVLDDGSLCLHY